MSRRVVEKEKDAKERARDGKNTMPQVREGKEGREVHRRKTVRGKSWIIQI